MGEVPQFQACMRIIRSLSVVIILLLGVAACDKDGSSSAQSGGLGESLELPAGRVSYWYEGPQDVRVELYGSNHVLNSATISSTGEFPGLTVGAPPAEEAHSVSYLEARMLELYNTLVSFSDTNAKLHFVEGLHYTDVIRRCITATDTTQAYQYYEVSWVHSDRPGTMTGSNPSTTLYGWPVSVTISVSVSEGWNRIVHSESWSEGQDRGQVRLYDGPEPGGVRWEYE